MLGIALTALVGLARARTAHPSLPRLSIDPSAITISGLSSGADFASQFAVAYSRTISGVGVFAGQPFHCAATRFATDALVPMNPEVPVCDSCPAGQTIPYDHCKHIPYEDINATALVAAARQRTASGEIDDVVHLQTTKVYTYCGTSDGSLNATMANRDFFARLVPAENILFNFSLPSGHCWPSDSSLLPCKVVLKNFWPVENCGYDGPGAMLRHFYGALKPPTDKINAASLRKFDQASYNDPAGAVVTGLSATGWLYTPQSCQNNSAKCKLHVSMHGCSELALAEQELVEGSKATGLSFNRWAESNGIVVLWPHAGPHGGKNATHEEKQGCWDGYGQTGTGYDTKQGVQMRAISKMIEDISGVVM